MLKVDKVSGWATKNYNSFSSWAHIDNGRKPTCFSDVVDFSIADEKRRVAPYHVTLRFTRGIPVCLHLEIYTWHPSYAPDPGGLQILNYRQTGCFLLRSQRGDTIWFDAGLVTAVEIKRSLTDGRSHQGVWFPPVAVTSSRRSQIVEVVRCKNTEVSCAILWRNCDWLREKIVSYYRALLSSFANSCLCGALIVLSVTRFASS